MTEYQHLINRIGLMASSNIMVVYRKLSGKSAHLVAYAGFFKGGGGGNIA